MDMIVVDGDLPDGTGESFIRHVRAGYAYKIIKVIGRPGDPRRESSFITAGADIVCPKPDSDKLLEAIQAFASV
jgi:DNA-binding response OmpR family regulator